MTIDAPIEDEVSDSGPDGSVMSELNMPGPLVRRMMLIALICVLLAGWLAAWVVSRASAEELSSRLVRQQTDEVELVARLLASKIEQSQKVLGTVAEGITPQMLQSPSLLEWMLQQGLPALRFFDAVEIARADGRLILNLQNGKMEPAASLDAEERDILLRTMVKGKPQVSGVLGSVAGLARIMFTLPIVADDGKVSGVVGGVLRLQSQGLLPHSLGLPGRDDSRLIVFTSDGVILSHPELERVMGNVASEPGLGEAYARWREERTPISTGRGETATIDDRLVSMAGVPMPQWWVARVTDTRALLALYGAQHRKLWIAAACVLTFGLLAMLIMAWVALPLTRLHRRAQAILLSQGTPESRPETSEEPDMLTGALDHLEAQQLHNGHQAEFSRLQLQGILEQAPVGIVITRNDVLEFLSQQASLMLGYSRVELEGRSVKCLFADEGKFGELERQIREGAATRRGYEGEFALRRKDGSLLWARVLGRMAFDLPSAMAAVWVLEDVAAAHDERHGSSRDALTNLPNRSSFLERLKAQLVRNAELTRAEQLSPGSGVALLFIDLDHFTLVNDRLGHEAGDLLLKQFSSMLEELVRHVGWAARLGGDEFAVVLPDCTVARAEMVAEHIRASVEAWEFSYEGELSNTTVSIGIVVAPADLEDVTPWLRAADMACYYAKRAGRNRAVIREMTDKAAA